MSAANLRRLINLLESEQSSLANYRAIGWDFDNTLIDNLNAASFADFIMAHPHIRHIIVTFRTHGMQRQIWHDLRHHGSALERSHFVGVLSIEDDAWSDWNDVQMRRQLGAYTGPETEEEHYYTTWKGKICRDHNIPVLVDDDVVNARTGCELYGVAFIDSKLPFRWSADKKPTDDQSDLW